MGGKLAPYWEIGEAAAVARLDAFLADQVGDYPEGRNVPAEDVTSRLSPHLRFGEISPRQVWHTAKAYAHAHPARAAAIDKFLSELAWRDFSYHQLYHRADISKVSMQEKYERLEWRSAPKDLARWEQGQTGIPIVDAGLRELWETGYMHNRVRMLVASLLSKNMLIDWRLGEAWFWDCLVDADIANNPASWQWVAGSGLDAAPYFRIFNPVTQGERFDPAGKYVRRWVPEIADLPTRPCTRRSRPSRTCSKRRESFSERPIRAHRRPQGDPAASPRRAGIALLRRNGFAWGPGARRPVAPGCDGRNGLPQPATALACAHSAH